MSELSEDEPPLEVYLLGMVDFDEIQSLQRRLVYDLGERGGGALILCEHPPTISVGRSGSRAHIRADDDQLREFGIKTRWVNRGGGCVLHLPGQLAAYLALPLGSMGLDLNGYLDRLQNAVIGTLREFELAAETRPEASGIFLGYARVASVGVAVNRWIAYHGVTINVGLDLEPFEILLNEPGIGSFSLKQTSMESRRQRPAPMAKVREALIRQVETEFGLPRHHVYTSHPLLGREARPRVHVTSDR